MALASKVTSNQWARFARATASPATPRLVGLSLQKETGSGTSHFWLTAPGPIVVFSLTPGDLEGVVEQFAEQKPVYLKEYEWAPTPDGSFDKDIAVKLRDEFTADFLHACQIARTVILDKESHVWDLFRYAEFGSPKAEIPRDFDAVNALYKKMIMKPKALQINFGMIQLMKDDWASATKKSGGLKPWGFGECRLLSHVIIEHEIAQEGGNNFDMLVTKSRGPGRADVQNKSFRNLTIPDLGMMLFPDTELGDWQ